MRNENDFKDIDVRKLIDDMEESLKGLPLHVNTYTAYYLKMFAITADAVHLRKVLENLLDNWCHRLPFVDETGVDIDWDEIKGKFYPFILKYQPDTTHSIFEEIKSWEETEMDDFPKRPNHKDYKMELDCLVKQDNLGTLIAEDYIFCNDMTSKTEECIRQLLGGMHTNVHQEVERLLVYELYRILLLADNLKAVLRTPSQIISNKERRDGLIAEFFKRIQKKCHVKIERVKNEYVTWLETYHENMSKELLIEKRERYWKKVEMSGFLADLEKVYRHNVANNYRSLFFDEKGLKSSFAGVYIYTRQLKYPDWKKKTEHFLFFAAVNEMITVKMTELVKKEEAETIAMYISNPPTRNELIARSIRQLMKEEDKVLGGKLITKLNQWIAIQRILMEYYGFSDKPKEFEGQMKSLKLENVDYPCKQENLKKPYDEILFKEFTKWEEHKERENPQNAAFLRQYHVAVRLLEILEANKVEKASGK